MLICSADWEIKLFVSSVVEYFVSRVSVYWFAAACAASAFFLGVYCRRLFCRCLCGGGFRLGVCRCCLFRCGLCRVRFCLGICCGVCFGVCCGPFGFVRLCGGCGSVCGRFIRCGLCVGCVVVGLVCRLLGGLGGGLEGVQRLLDAGCCCVGLGDFGGDLLGGLSNKVFVSSVVLYSVSLPSVYCLPASMALSIAAWPFATVM